MISGVTVGLFEMGAWTLPNCCKFLRIFMIITLLHSAYSAISHVISDSLSYHGWDAALCRGGESWSHIARPNVG